MAPIRHGSAWTPADLGTCATCREHLPPDLLGKGGICPDCWSARYRRRLEAMDEDARVVWLAQEAARKAAQYRREQARILTRKRQRRRARIHHTTWPIPNHGKPWATDERLYVSTHITTMAPDTIAQRLGRTTQAVMSLVNRRRYAPTRMHLMTTAEVAAEWGVSVQYVARLAREGRLTARRVPLGRMWLYNAETLPARPPRR